MIVHEFKSSDHTLEQHLFMDTKRKTIEYIHILKYIYNEK